MATNHTIGNGTRWAMLSVALFFDFIQFITPGFTDTFITATAALVFMMWFQEKGALTLKGKGAVALLRWILPPLELLFSHMPGIFLTVWAQITVSRAIDSAPEPVKELYRKRLQRGMAKERTLQRGVAKGELKQLKEYAYGKGRRGARASERAIDAEGSPRTAQVQRQLETKKVV